MKYLTPPLSALIAFCFLLLSSAVFSGNFVAIGKTPGFNIASISHELNNSKDNSKRNTFLSDEYLSLSFTLNIDPIDVGLQSEIYLVALYNQQYYMRDQNAQWQLWDGQLATLQASSKKTLLKQENIIVLNKQRRSAGEYLVYAGYKTKFGDIKYNAEPASFLISEHSTAKLHRIQNHSFLKAYIGKTQNINTSYYIGSSGSPFSGNSPSTSSSSTSGISTSQTNLQEAGVDESDIIKTSGDILFTLEDCSISSQNSWCLGSYQMHESPASTNQLDQITLINKSNYESKGLLFLNESSLQTPANKLIWLSTKVASGDILGSWFLPQYWMASSTGIQFFDISAPDNIKAGKSLYLEGSLVTSRRIDNQLYLITRLNHDPESSLSNLSPLPDISFEQNTAKSLVKATDCYVPASRSDQSYDGTIITITRLSIDDPEDFTSTCIVGNIETVYVSTKAIYLATSRYPYSVSSGSVIYDQVPEYRTEIHKFTMAKQQITYAASGSVPGHLGWEMDKKPFRMGESNGVLKVATSLGATWNITPSTRVAVLKENSDSQILEEISFIDNLGKPGEKLYAARFIGNRGYLVTFRKADPLYMLDFSEPESPKILGELEIPGYSDYLHPIGENYLLGIGKDAKVGANADWGAYDQGIKLSLFDVSDGNNLHEIQSIIIGKRGSDSRALYDHHALAWLPSSDPERFRLAIPISENSTPNKHYTYDQAYHYYDWTQTGAYVFDIHTGQSPSLVQSDQLITEAKADGDQLPFTWSDRLVLQGDALHYIHNSTVYSKELNP